MLFGLKQNYGFIHIVMVDIIKMKQKLKKACVRQRTLPYMLEKHMYGNVTVKCPHQMSNIIIVTINFMSNTKPIKRNKPR